MKELLILIPLLVGAAVCEAPYPASGWKPTGPKFELPPKTPQNARPEYFPPEPRNPSIPDFDDEEDLSVQGLPPQKQKPDFQQPPFKGQFINSQYDSRIRDPNQDFRRSQYENRQENNFARQLQSKFGAPVSTNFQTARPGPSTNINSDNIYDYERESTTESFTLNEGESIENKDNDTKINPVEISKQNILEIKPELLISALSDLQFQPQLQPLGQIRAPIFFQPIQQPVIQKQLAYDGPTHFPALSSILSQKQNYDQPQIQYNINQNPIPPQPNNIYDPNLVRQFRTQPGMQPQFQQADAQQPMIYVQPQYQPVNQYLPTQPASFDQNQEGNQNSYSQNQPQLFYQPQFMYQPQPEPQFYQPQPAQFLPPEQNIVYSGQLIRLPNEDYNQYYLDSTYQQQIDQNKITQGTRKSKDSPLQSDFDANQQDNGIEQNEDKNEFDRDPNDGSTATAVATAFGARSRPRVQTQYGLPSAFPKYASPFEPRNPNAEEEISSKNDNVVNDKAERNGKLRTRRIRPASE